MVTETFKLDNGLRVVFVPDRNKTSIFIQLTGKNGAKYEDADSIGIAHFLEHLVFEGTKNYPDKEALTELIEFVGGEYNGSTTKSFTSYYAKVLKKDVHNAFEYLKEIIINPLLSEKAFKIQKKIVLSEYLRRYGSNPKLDFESKIDKTLWFSNQRVAEIIIGRTTHIKNLKLEKVKDFYDKNYHAGNFVLQIVGDLNLEEAKDYATKYFSDMKPGEENISVYPIINSNKKVFIYNDPKAKHLILNLHYQNGLNMTDNRRFAAIIMHNILVQERLYKIIREDLGLAYAIYGNMYNTQDFGMSEITTEIEAKNLKLVCKIIKQEVKKLQTSEINPYEFEKIKNIVVAQFAFENEKSTSIAEYNAERLLGPNKDLTRSEIQKLYEKVEVKDILEAANICFNSDPKIALFSKNIKEKEMLKIWKEA